MHLAHFVRSLRRSRLPLAAVVVVFTLALAAPCVLAQCQTNTTCWPPPGVTCAYPAPGPAFYPSSPGPHGIRNLEMSEPTSCVPLPPQGGSSIDSFFDIVIIIELTSNGGGSWSPPGSGPGSCVVRIQPPVPVGPDQFFDTEMLQLDITGGGLPPGTMLRESPTRQSQGGTTLRDLGGGLYQIDSFFDVFTELSLDGGQTWHESSQPLHVTTVDRSQTPTHAGTWGAVKIRYR